MKVVDLTNFKTAYDQQIQISAARLWVKVTMTNGTGISGVKFTLRIQDPVQGVLDITPIPTEVETLFELAQAREGHYVIDTNNDEQPWTVSGMVDVTDGTALQLGDGRYISLSVDSVETILRLEIWTIPAPVAEPRYRRYNPVTIQGAPKELALAGVSRLALRPQDLTSLRMQYGAANSEYLSPALVGLAHMVNDIVSVNVTTRGVVAGLREWFMMATSDASRAMVVPATPNQITVYLIESKAI